MISGPVTPRTRGGLRELLQRHLEGVECGLTVLAEELEFEPECVVDALAADVSGRPVAIFLAAELAPPVLVARVLAAAAWWQSGAELLARVLPLDRVDYSRPPRLLVVGLELEPSLCAQLASLASLGVEAYELRSLRVAGRDLVGIVPVLGGRALGAENGFCPPSGVEDPKARGLWARMLSLLEDLDAGLRVEGDRYSRRVRVGSRLLAELSLAGGELAVRVSEDSTTENPAESPQSTDRSVRVLIIRTAAECHEALDRIMRRYLRLTAAQEPAADEVEARPDGSGADRAPFARLRRVVSSSQLSPQEYSYLSGSGPGKD